ncbi:MAG TPA: RluA family pseudouridine synthase [Polyangiaceae bacterium]|nr:RluA family pseudouridine synthase [Polyangiaceae bacterium]
MPDAPKPPPFPWTVPPSHAGRMLDGALRERDPSLSWANARALVETGKVFRNGAPCLVPRQHLRAGDRIEVRPNAPRPREQRRIGFDDFVYVDRQVAVVRKPAGVSTVPFDPGERGTLDEMVRLALDRQARARGGPAQGWIGVVHRLDKDTTGLLVFARTLAAKRHLGNQFRAHSVDRRYVALAHGAVRSQTIRSRLVADRGDGLRGSTRLPNAGQEAVTRVEALEPLGPVTLVACRLETGRTHQIRIHLSEAGHPLVGEDVYVRDFRGERVPAPRPMLHAEELGFVHPTTGEPLLFRDDWPDDFADLAERLRAAGGRGRESHDARRGRSPR